MFGVWKNRFQSLQQCTLFEAKKMLQGHHCYSSAAQLALHSIEDHYQADVLIAEAVVNHSLLDFCIVSL